MFAQLNLRMVISSCVGINFCVLYVSVKVFITPAKFQLGQVLLFEVISRMLSSEQL